jgi:hypothetical protein
MSIEIRDVDGGLGNIIIGRGIIIDEEYVDALKEHLTQDENKFKKYRYSLSDYTATAEIDIATKSVDLIAHYCRKASIVNPEAVVAIITNEDLIYGLARMWEILIDETDWETMVFRNRKDAEAWIRERVKEKYGIEDLTFT